jgi:hypothetical protein
MRVAAATGLASQRWQRRRCSVAVTGWTEEEDGEAGGGTLQRRRSDVMALLVLDLQDDESKTEREMRETGGEKREGTGFFNSA